MTSPIKILGILTLATTFAGTALAGNVTTSKPCPMMKAEYKLVQVGNPKYGINVTRRFVGYQSPGCVGTNIANMTCVGSKETCRDMIRS